MHVLKQVFLIMKILFSLALTSVVLLLAGCAGAGQDAAATPVGSVVTGETKDPDAYLQRVRQDNEAKTREASVNQTTFQSHEHTNFGSRETHDRTNVGTFGSDRY